VGADISDPHLRGARCRLKRVTQVRTAHQGRLIASYVTFGRYDTIWISEYPNERAAFDAMNTIRTQGDVQVRNRRGDHARRVPPR
jgi:uncharacterized protein with GYD domain